MDKDEESKNKILEFAEQHPYVLIAVIAVLFIIILLMYFSPSTLGMKEKLKKGPKNIDEDEMDELINRIHEKQKKRE